MRRVLVGFDDREDAGLLGEQLAELREAGAVTGELGLELGHLGGEVVHPALHRVDLLGCGRDVRCERSLAGLRLGDADAQLGDPRVDCLLVLREVGEGRGRREGGGADEGEQETAPGHRLPFRD